MDQLVKETMTGITTSIAGAKVYTLFNSATHESKKK